MNYKELYNNILKKKSFLCIGLDTNPALIPDFLSESEYPLFEFNKAIIDATSAFAVAYKPNLAFYEALGYRGWMQLEMTVEYIRSKDPSLFIIADAKRGDIGNTAERYAVAFFERMDCDAVTLAPYMGKDSVAPFLKFSGHWAVVLALTSNPSAEDFETLVTLEESSFFLNGGAQEQTGLSSKQVAPLFRRVIETAMSWGTQDNTMFVVGATRPEKLAEIREYCPNHFFLVPGVGAQGGSLKEVVKYGMNSSCGLLVNISRDIIFAWKKEKSGFSEQNYAQAAAVAAEAVALEMKNYL
ncbi:MAG: orotidine-5'-phosphate decarboxylase [Bacteroidales bacterium]|nr:orotidine-5'-phosphate decarboxylase [Bacteroidales bacterium]